jgi:hypothetical protein
VLILGDPVDAEQVVVGYGEENVAAWAGVVITAVSSEDEVFWASFSNQPCWQVEFPYPVVIGAVQFRGTWSSLMNDEKHYEHITGEFHDLGNYVRK